MIALSKLWRDVGVLGLAVTAAATLAPSARAGVIVVDPGGGDGAALLQTALVDAVDGDIVLVRDGTYVLPASQRFLITNKGLTLATDAATPPTLSGLEVHHMVTGQVTIVRGFTLGPVTWDDGVEVPTVFVHDTDGVVWIEDCAIVGRQGAAHYNFIGYDLRDGSPAVQAGNAVTTLQPGTWLTLQRCTLTGGKGVQSTKPLGTDTGSSSGGPALSVWGAGLSLHECTLQGGNAGNGFFWPFKVADGGDGARLQGSEVLFAGCDVRGGSNGSQLPLGGDDSSDAAGNGLTVSSGKALLRDSSFASGTVVSVGVPGVAIEQDPFGFGTYTMPAPARSFSLTSPLQEGASGSLHIDGEPGDFDLLIVGTVATSYTLSGNQGVLVVNPFPVLHLLPLGAADANGDIDFNFTMPNLPASAMGTRLLMQLAVQSGGGVTLEASSALAWLDSSL